MAYTYKYKAFIVIDYWRYEMATLSLCMIVKNEEDVLERCLSSVSDIVDEMIIVDTGSTDKTKDIAKEFNCFIYDYNWIDDFAAARNYSFSKATKDYILWLDADDVLLESDCIKLKVLKGKMDLDVDSYSMFYHYATDEHGNVTLRFRRNRIVKRERAFKWHGFVHEYIQVEGQVVNTDIAVTHMRVHQAGDRNLSLYMKKEEEGYIFDPRDTYYYAKELYDHQKYQEACEKFDEFLGKNEGWVENKIVACYKVADYYLSMKNYKASRDYLLKTLEYDLPRGEGCYRLGRSYQEENRIQEAIFWFTLATNIKKPDSDWGFMDESSYTWLPHLQLCVCYYNKGDIDKAYKHHKLSQKYNSEHESVLYNQSFFKSIGYQ